MTTEQSVVVEHENGLHARPASSFVQTASTFDSEITVRKHDDDTVANAKSSISVLSLDIKPNEEIIISADGEEAVERLVELVKNDFELEG